MGMDLAVKKFSMEPEHFVAGLYPIAKAAKTAAAALDAHAPVALDADGKLAALTKETAADVYGLVPEAVAADEETPVYLTGEFFEDSLALPEGMTAADVEAPLRKIGIFLK